MLQVQPNIIYASDNYFKRGEKSARTRLVNKAKEIIKQRDAVIAEETKKTGGTPTPEIAKQVEPFNKELASIQEKLDELDGKAQLRYMDDVKGDLTRLIADAKEIIEQVVFNDFFIDFAILMYYTGASKRKEAFKKDFIDRTAYIIYGYCDEQKAAAEKYGVINELDKAIEPICHDKAIKFLDDFGGIDKIIDYRKNNRQQIKSLEKEINGEQAILTKYATPPDRFYTPNSYIASSFPLWSKLYYEGQISFGMQTTSDITGKTNEGSVPIYYSITPDTDLIDEDGREIISYNKARIKGFDIAILDAICSFLEAGHDTLYVTAIDRLMRGGRKTDSISDTRQERILQALRKLSGTRLYLNVTNDTSIPDNIKECVYDEAMLTYSGLQMTTYAGQKTYVFNVKTLPPLYRYSKAKGEIVSFPTNLLDTGDRAEERTTPLKVQLLKRITLINKRQLSQTSIKYEYIYNRADVEIPQTRAQMNRDISRFKEWLTFWQKIGYIKGFMIDKQGVSITPNYTEPKKRYDKPVKTIEQTDL